MKTRILLGLGLMAFQSPYTWATPKNSLCLKARVESLLISHIKKFPQGIEVCHLTEATTIPGFKQALADLGDIHQKAASLLGVPLAKILPKGMKIQITASTGGLNGSAKADTRVITIDTLPNPSSWVNRGIYAHEFGHYLSFMATPSTPLAIKSTNGISQFGETIADTMALALVGEDTSREKNYPACLSQERVGLNQTYKSQFGDFDFDAHSHKLINCCQENANHTEEFKNICDGLFVGEDGEVALPGAFDQEPFSIKKMSEKNIDPHRIGIPINSFLKSLGQKVKKNLAAEFIKILNQPMKLNFSCGLPGSKLAIQKVTVPAYSLKDIMDKLKQTLMPEQQNLFQKLWIKHDLATAVALDVLDQPARSETLAREHFINLLEKPSDSFLKKKKFCREALVKWKVFGVIAGCEITCQQI